MHTTLASASAKKKGGSEIYYLHSLVTSNNHFNNMGLGYNVAAAGSQRTERALQPVRASKRDHTFETWTLNVCDACETHNSIKILYFSMFRNHVSLIGTYVPIGGIGITGSVSYTHLTLPTILLV